MVCIYYNLQNISRIFYCKESSTILNMQKYVTHNFVSSFHAQKWIWGSTWRYLSFVLNFWGALARKRNIRQVSWIGMQGNLDANLRIYSTVTLKKWNSLVELSRTSNLFRKSYWHNQSTSLLIRHFVCFECMTILVFFWATR